MKSNKMIVAMLMLAMCIITGNSFAQTKSDTTAMKGCCMMKDCCVMKDGKMMMMKDGKMMPMDKNMTMKNGTECTTSGECIMKNGKKMKMKEGQCMDMNGKMDKCTMGNESKCCNDKKGASHDMAVTYTCPMHPDVVSDKPGKCPKCGMELVKKK